MQNIQKPDLDNLIKAIGDAVYQNDSAIWDIHTTKRWGREGKIIVKASSEISDAKETKGERIQRGGI